MRFRFPIVIIDEDFRSENASGLGIRALVSAIKHEGMEVLGVISYGDMASFAQQQSRASAFVLSIDDEEFLSTEAAGTATVTLHSFVQEIRLKNADIPIFLCGETHTSRHIPNDVLRELHGFIHMFEDTPEFVNSCPTYERYGLRDLCQQIYAIHKENDIARLTTEMYLLDIQPALRPADAFAKVAHHEIERVLIDKLEGRIASVLLTPYPPGIPLLIPGERFNSTIVKYLQFARDFNARFPGFDTDIHGLIRSESGEYMVD